MGIRPPAAQLTGSQPTGCHRRNCIAIRIYAPLFSFPISSIQSFDYFYRTGHADQPLNLPSTALSMQNRTIFILLSSKGAGSSGLKNYLNANFGINLIAHSPHFENETLFWSKAASILGMPQDSMHRSEVPISYKKAVIGMEEFLHRNGIQISLNRDTPKEEFFELFLRLCENTGFPVTEKSPHHLFNFSNIQLIIDFQQYMLGRVNVVLLGMVRNPIDTVYSAWCRWRYNCSDFEREWLASYRHLHELVQSRIPVTVFRYEDLCGSTEDLDEFLMTSCGFIKRSNHYTFHNRSLQKWKRDGLFEYIPSVQAQAVAADFGYTPSDLRDERDPSLWWTLREVVNGWRFKMRETEEQQEEVEVASRR